MREISFEESKKLELDILLDIHKFCEENGLSYFLAYGTLIGALRHKGFIPWDDDIDIQMPRADYNKLIETYKSDRYTLIKPGSARAVHSFVKIIDERTVKIEPEYDYKNGNLGIDIDIFPIDGAPQDDAQYDKWFNKLRRIYRNYVYAMKKPEGSFKHVAKVKLIKLFLKKPEYYLRKAEELHRLYPYESSQYVAAVESCFNGKGNRVKAECFDGFTLVPFEGYQLRAPLGYDTVLRSLYGDYMKMPPADKQVTHHSNNVTWKEEMYEKV